MTTNSKDFNALARELGLEAGVELQINLRNKVEIITLSSPICYNKSIKADEYQNQPLTKEIKGIKKTSTGFTLKNDFRTYDVEIQVPAKR